MKKILLISALVVVFAADVLIRQFGTSNQISMTNTSATQAPLVSSPIAQTSPTPASQSQPQQQTPSQPQTSPPKPKNQGVYKDGVYTGSVADAYYGNVQVQVTIQSGKIADVQFLQYPDTHGTSIAINGQAMPYLKQEAVQAQSANVDIVSGATQTSLAFQQSLAAALTQAKV